MPSSLPTFVLGYHGCDKKVGEKILSGKANLNFSENNYDWLGNGIYFWENDPTRAIDYAKSIKDNPERGNIKEPFVIGAVIDLGHCLNLLECNSLQVLKQGYVLLKKALEKSQIPLPENLHPLHEENDLLLRNLDNAVITMVHTYNKESNSLEYDSVRAAFWEGEDLYPNAGFKEKNHIQICVRNKKCVKGLFRVNKS